MQKLRVAIPSGRLAPCATARIQAVDADFTGFLPRAYQFESERFCYRLVKPRAIPKLLAHGLMDIGFCGLDLVLEADVSAELTEVADLGVDKIRIVAAARHKDILEHPPNRPLIIATEYPRLASEWAFHRGLAHILIETFGTTEGYATDADVIVDCVASSATMKANELVILDTIAASSTRIFARAGLRGNERIECLTQGAAHD